ncbi:MAG: killer suppression protein [Chloroflexia bacterium]|nr:killer suppression protein [Chloroflexia bacterium]
MNIVFPNERMAATFNSLKELSRIYGAEHARRILKRLNELQAAANLEVMRSLPGRCHELKHNRAGQLAIDVRHPYRLIFEPAHEPIPRKDDGGLDWSKVTNIRIVEVEDYHG